MSLFDCLTSENKLDLIDEQELETENEDTNLVIDPNIRVFRRDEEVPDLSRDKIRVWKYEPMFKENIQGARMIWEIGADMDRKIIFVHHGHVDGKIQRDETKIELNNSGKNYHEQALQEIQYRYTKKSREGYHSAREPPPTKGPMRGNLFKEKKKFIVYPVGVTTKIDGIRCLVNEIEDGLKYRSKENREWHHLHNIFDYDLKLFYSFLPPGLQLDGELFSEHLTFSKIESVVKSEVNTDEKGIRENIKYYIFDSNEDKPFEQRFHTLLKAYQKYATSEEREDMLVLLNPTWLNNEKEVMNYYEMSLASGFEGAMVRSLGSSAKTEKQYKLSLYISGKRNNILKIKEQDDEEGIIVDIIEGRGKEEGLALFVMRDPRGNKVRGRPAMSYEEREYIFLHKNDYIGKKVTYSYQGLTDYGVPRNIVPRRIRDYE